MNPQLNYGGLLVRGTATILDFLLIIFPIVILQDMLPVLGITIDIPPAGLLIIVIIYNVITIKTYGQTLGKHVFGLRVKDINGSELSWIRVILRESVFKYVISGLLLGLGYLNIIRDQKKQAFHDKLAHTVVIQEYPLNILQRAISTLVGLILLFFLVGIPLIKLYRTFIVYKDNLIKYDLIDSLEQKRGILEVSNTACFINGLNEYNNTIQSMCRKEKRTYSCDQNKSTIIYNFNPEELKLLNAVLENTISICVRLQYTIAPSPGIYPATQKNLPTVYGANMLIRAIDEQGQQIAEGTVEISIEHPGERSYYNYQYVTDLSSVKNGLLALHPPPSSSPADIKIRITTPSGKRSDTFVINNVEFWQAVEKTRQNFVTCHAFNFQNSNLVTNATYSTEHCW